MSAPSDPTGRRDRLSATANPDQTIDYLVGLHGVLPCARAIAVRFVPDKLILGAAAFDGYLAALGAEDWPSPEALALAMRADFNNELVPRWLVVTVEGPHHKVVIEDRQPGWENATLLARLAPV